MKTKLDNRETTKHHAASVPGTKGGEPIRGLMLDPARLTERHFYYFDLLPDLAKWGYNTLWWHFMDDEGFAQKLRSRPELASPYAFSLAEARRFVALARSHGIDVVPEVESLGHTLSVTRLPQYAHLFNGRPFGHNAMCPSHPDTLALLRDIIPEVAELFGGKYLHAGLDESNLSGCERCAERNRGKPPWHVLAEHIIAAREIVAACGRRMVMWADSIERNPELLQVLPKDIVLAHWNYSEIPVEKIEPSVDAGFEIICVSAISGSSVQTNAKALRNHDGMVELSNRLSSRGSIGVVTCWWEPFGRLRDTYRTSMAYAGESMVAGKALDKEKFFGKISREFFGCRGKKTGRALLDLMNIMLPRGTFKAMFYDSVSDFILAIHLAMDESFAKRREESLAVLESLESCSPGVSRHYAEFVAHLLAARVVVAAYDNAAAALEAHRLHTRAASAEEVGGDRGEIAQELLNCREVLASRIAPMKELARELEMDWDRTRHPHDPKKHMKSPYVRQRIIRGLVHTVTRNAAYVKESVRSFDTSIRGYRKTGDFPGGLCRPSVETEK